MKNLELTEILRLAAKLDDHMKNLELDLSFTETMPNLWETYEIVLLAYGPEASETEFDRIMGAAGFGDCDLWHLYRDFKWYVMCARPERIRRGKD